MKQYDKVLENQELCFKVGKSQILKFLFFAAIQLEKFETGIKTGHAIEKAEDLTDEFKPSFYAYFAKLFFSTGENEKAVDYLTKANDVHIIRNLIYEYDFDKDEDIRKRILNLLSSLLEKTENKDLANFLLGIVHTRLEDNDIATEYMNEISDDFLEENDLLFIAASIYLQNSLDIKKAQSLLEKLEQEELTPNEIIAGLLFSTENDSISYFMLKTEIIENPEPHISTFIRYSILAERFNTIDSLIILLEKGVKLYPENADLLNGLGYLIAKHGVEEKYDHAETLLEKALILEPESIMIWDSMAWLYFMKGETKKAFKAMKLPLESEIEHSEIAYHLGEIFLKLNKEKKAKKYFKLAIELNNEDEAVELSRHILKEIFKE